MEFGCACGGDSCPEVADAFPAVDIDGGLDDMTGATGSVGFNDEHGGMARCSGGQPLRKEGKAEEGKKVGGGRREGR